MKRWGARWLRAIQVAMAYVLFPFLPSYTIGSWLGVLPYVPVSSERYVSRVFSPPTLFPVNGLSDPLRDRSWDRPRPSRAVPSRMLVIPSGLANHQGYVFDAMHRPLAGASHPQRQRMKYQWKNLKHGIPVSYMRSLDGPARLPGRVGVCTSTQQRIYAHWLLDILPRLGKLQELNEPIDAYFVERQMPFQVDSLQLVSLDAPCIVDSTRTPWIQADELVVPCHQIMYGYHHPEWVRVWLRKTFLPHAIHADVPKRRVYVSRAHAARRRVANEPELTHALHTHGFETVVLETLSFCEQVGVFHDADVIVAPHGSGLANLVFCRPGTCVVELFPARAIDIFYRLSADMRLVYRALKTRDAIPWPRVNDNFSVAIEDLERVLKTIDT